jgi:hypothetical protein
MDKLLIQNAKKARFGLLRRVASDTKHDEN